MMDKSMISTIVDLCGKWALTSCQESQAVFKYRAYFHPIFNRQYDAGNLQTITTTLYPLITDHGWAML